MNITALDTYVIDFDGLSWDEFLKLGDFTKYDRSADSEIIERCKNTQAVITNKIIFDKARIEALPALRYIGITATGTNNVDLKFAKSQGITVTNVPAYSTDSVSQLIISFILNYASRTESYNRLVKSGRWEKSSDFCFFEYPVLELKGKNLGIIGYGAIGKRTAEIAAALGMNILISEVPGRTYDDQRLSIEEVMSKADFVSLSCPLNENTQNIINKERLSLMKKSAVLINTARGGLIDESALYEALQNRIISHACLDVLSKEPPDSENRLLYSDHTTITPHIAWGSRESRQRLLREAAQNLAAFQKSQLRNTV